MQPQLAVPMPEPPAPFTIETISTLDILEQAFGDAYDEYPWDAQLDAIRAFAQANGALYYGYPRSKSWYADALAKAEAAGQRLVIIEDL